MPKFDCFILLSAVHSRKDIIELAVEIMEFNPNAINGFSHPYQLDEATLALRGIRSIFFHFIVF